MTHRNEPPELVALKPSWEVVPSAPPTTPPPRTAAPDDATAEGGRAISAADTSNGKSQRKTRTAAIRPPFSSEAWRRGRRPAELAEIPAAGAIDTVCPALVTSQCRLTRPCSCARCIRSTEIRPSVPMRNGIAKRPLRVVRSFDREFQAARRSACASIALEVPRHDKAGGHHDGPSAHGFRNRRRSAQSRRGHPSPSPKRGSRRVGQSMKSGSRPCVRRSTAALHAPRYCGT